MVLDIDRREAGSRSPNLAFGLGPPDQTCGSRRCTRSRTDGFTRIEEVEGYFRISLNSANIRERRIWLDETLPADWGHPHRHGTSTMLAVADQTSERTSASVATRSCSSCVGKK
jgi:hypothetical protein